MSNTDNSSIDNYLRTLALEMAQSFNSGFKFKNGLDKSLIADKNNKIKNLGNSQISDKSKERKCSSEEKESRKLKLHNKSKIQSKEIQPIHERIDKILYEKMNKINQLKDEISLKRIEKIEIRSKSCFDEKKFNEWISKNDNWESKKKKKIRDLKENSEFMENLTLSTLFKPFLNKNSTKFNKYNSQEKIPIYKKLDNYSKIKEKNLSMKASELIPKFEPEINKNVDLKKVFRSTLN